MEVSEEDYPEGITTKDTKYTKTMVRIGRVNRWVASPTGGVLRFSPEA